MTPLKPQIIINTIKKVLIGYYFFLFIRKAFKIIITECTSEKNFTFINDILFFLLLLHVFLMSFINDDSCHISYNGQISFCVWTSSDVIKQLVST